MNSYFLSQIFIYPIKSLGRISIKESLVTDRGLKYDRRWMIVDSNGNFISQRTKPEMALITTDINNNKIILRHKKTSEQVEFEINETTNRKIKSKVWNDEVELLHVNNLIDEWLSINLNIRCKLVYMPDNEYRYVDSKYSVKNEITNLSDGFPFLLIGQKSLDDLNEKLNNKIGFDRFRPNLVFVGGNAFDEDKWKYFEINEIKFFPVKPCSRCKIITTDQNTSQIDDEHLKILSTYRSYNNKIFFGQNLIHDGDGIIKVGDRIEKIYLKENTDNLIA